VLVAPHTPALPVVVREKFAIWLPGSVVPMPFRFRFALVQFGTPLTDTE
jgi:hypothetical protein